LVSNQEKVYGINHTLPFYSHDFFFNAIDNKKKINVSQSPPIPPVTKSGHLQMDRMHDIDLLSEPTPLPPKYMYPKCKNMFWPVG
jgi:hypothetical protein